MKLIYQTVKRIAVGLINQFDGSLIYLGQKSLCAGVWSTVEPSSKVSPGVSR